MDFGDDYGISRKEAIEKLKLSVQVSLHDPVRKGSKNKLAKARKTRTSPSTLGLKKFGLGKLWVKKVFWVKNVFRV